MPSASIDFGAFDEIVSILSDRQCYQLMIINDNIRERVEPFHVYLNTAVDGEAVTFINKTLTVYIIDDGE